ncbi:MAG: hypothetical protein M1830_004602 [Pleopsidium flavum]|nr:MAG: hypothetical protein M1830_004602 [Pleopsidium flavum]
MSTEFITFCPQPGHSISSYDRHAPSSEQSSSVPSIFKEAMSIREEVFVHEQHVPLENELDADDPRSFHWVVYASVSSTQSTPDGRRSSEGGRVPVGTIRLVPPPHPPHPEPGTSHAIDNAEGGKPKGEADRKTSMHDGKEPYVKLGRLATLKPYRKLGLGSLMINTALEWAGKHPEQIMPLSNPMAREARKLAAGESERDERWNGLVLVHAQVVVEKMWAKYGFAKDEGMGVWDEEGIDHVGMWRRVPVKKI